jgi:hypothetical protein
MTITENDYSPIFDLIFGHRSYVLGLNQHYCVVAKSTPNNDLLIATRFAPNFYQALGDKPRSDYITNFDFDGDWRGDNNWNNSANLDFPLKAHIYYSVSETATHYFIHYGRFSSPRLQGR